MDTKLKKSHKLKNLIIALIVLIPAIVLVSLYPQMERAMLDKKEQWHQSWKEDKEAYELEQQKQKALSEILINEEITAESETPILIDEGAAEASVKSFYLHDDFINYAMEASYYQYALLLQEATGQESFTEVLDYYGWINDFYELKSGTPYYAKYIHRDAERETADAEYIMAENLSFSEEELERFFAGEELSDPRKSQMAGSGYLGYLVINYDSYGKLKNIRLELDESVDYSSDIYPRAKQSVEQYANNTTYYVQNNLENNPQNVRMAMSICPKDFQVIYLIYKDNARFVNDFYDNEETVNLYYTVEPYHAPENLYFATGAYWIVAALAVFVFLAAMILPFFKKLETGWEKLFSMPFEITLCIAAAGIALAFGMCILMSVTTMTEIENFMANGNSVELLGYRFSVSECYYTLLAVNFLGWILVFFLEYFFAAHLRQFFAKPVYYIRHRFLGILLICWIHKNIKNGVNYILNIEVDEEFHKHLIKIVVVNGIVVALLCCIWFAGILGALIYSIGLYTLLKKYGGRLQGQYQSISNKSQNMKYELITNVSHDLKTPLTSIITYVDLLKKDDLTEEERKSYVETLDVKSQRMKVLIDDLFEISKANSGNVQMNFMDVDVVKLLKEVRVEMSDKMEQSNLDFRFTLPEEKVILSLDGQRTYRIFENLLNNTIKYAMPFSRVYIDLVNDEKKVWITFKNMSAQELNFDASHLTERFVRGDSSRNSEGSGLGLAIAKSFTELQNGQFDILVDGDLFKVTIGFVKK